MFAEELRAILAKKCLTQKQAAEFLGVHIRTVEAWCRGIRTPKPLMQKAIFEMLKKHEKRAE